MKPRVRRLSVPEPLAELIRGLHPRIKRKLRAALEEITAIPQAGKSLRDELSGLRSLRLGKYRAIYRDPSVRRIELVAFGPRERIYEDTYHMISLQRRAEKSDK